MVKFMQEGDEEVIKMKQKNKMKKDLKISRMPLLFFKIIGKIHGRKENEGDVLTAYVYMLMKRLDCIIINLILKKENINKDRDLEIRKCEHMLCELGSMKDHPGPNGLRAKENYNYYENRKVMLEKEIELSEKILKKESEVAFNYFSKIVSTYLMGASLSGSKCEYMMKEDCYENFIQRLKL